jgi:hypothetical protein
MRRRKRARRLERSVEVLLGFVLLLLLPVPLALGVAAGSELLRGQSVLIGVLALSLSVLLIWFCAVVGWRLVTARRDAQGRLMPVWALYAGAFIGHVMAARGRVFYGLERANRDHEDIGKSLRESLEPDRSKRKR